MASILQGYEYDIFISYRHNDNLDGWVTDFVQNIEKELRGTLKEPVSIYFDTNPHDGLLETHNVDMSLENKLKCLIFIPIISRTYCDSKSFAWRNEFVVYNKMARADELGIDIKLPNGNITSRILPVKIHDIDNEDKLLLESELSGTLRAIEFIFKSPGVNRPLMFSDKREENVNKTFYRDQINKVANAIHDIIKSLKNKKISTTDISSDEALIQQTSRLSFRKKLAERNVLRASLVYILSAIVFWKVMIISTDILNVTENIIKPVTLLLIVLFPFAILLAWLFERSPQGFIRTGSVDSKENPFTDGRKKPFTSYTFISLLLITSLALFILFPMAGRTKIMNSVSDAEKSIAVLPFENLSNNSENEYFSKGVVEAINRYLSQIAELRVISLSSADLYKNTDKSTYEIAKELSISNFLEGSIQRFEKTVRIEVKLIDASTEHQIWAENYDREIDDIFKIQSEIAENVALALRATLSPEDKAVIDSGMTRNSKAYDLYLRGNYELNSYTRTGIYKAIEYFNQAIELDPDFALAYVGIAGCNIGKAAMFGAELNTLDAMSLASPYLKKALELDPDLSEALAWKGFYLLYNNWDFEGAEHEYRKAITTNNSMALTMYSDFLHFVQRDSEALIIAQRLNQTDPFYPNSRMILALYYLGRYDEAIQFGKARLNLFRNYSSLENYGFLMLNTDHCDEAIASFQKVLDIEGIRYPRVLGWMGAAYARCGKSEKAIQLLNELKAQSHITHAGSVDFFIAVIYAALGDKKSALHWIQEAYKNHEMEIPWLKSEPQFYSLRDEPEFQELLNKVGFP